MHTIAVRHRSLSRLSRSRYRLDLSCIFPSTSRSILSPIVLRWMERGPCRGLPVIYSSHVTWSYRFLEIRGGHISCEFDARNLETVDPVRFPSRRNVMVSWRHSKSIVRGHDADSSQDRSQFKF